ncbi:hypothetical protein conserved [Leishmania donovani]|uniref:Uncharacterized protein n=3 Tax=Leishmania donovani species complex TaxID=38574 RepID=A4I7A9_LEIIN|nr:conserved hypothetical protein [Leishmania infantum JPCM5]XP_003863400.1 hypothetical protein, conserved [Leishmania donovani]CAC9521741.1 hypothetical_protein_-_conserved [Leishmania infantum]AYU81523.1 hypothetical protein LdCL_310039900 [Leishmania donovani]CAJ1991514.1 hypothetical protein conserved [Leishmania donovani]CAM70693.1 conserved hypothetical protein [Leishmania infantum JPCM5]CBZ36714.1 hypothetical protein, conserved [Leishmania donovani]|eukprot:XP_001467628.1 conserved hypothetical protein [Leishmania infantum JPCM5]
MWRSIRRTSCPVPWMTVARWQSTSGKDAAAAAAPAANCTREATRADTSASVETPDAVNGGSAAQSSAKSDAYRFPAGEVMDAVKKRDFNAMQTHATKLVQSQWKEEYNVPAACVVIFIVMWYWIAWTRRSIRRKCEATKASVKQQTDEMVEIVRNMTEKWKVDMSKANKQMQGIIDKNSELTRDIDRMTTALRSCSIRPTAASAAAIAPTVSVVKRVDPVDEEAPAEATETAAGESSEALAMVEEDKD